MDQLRIFGFPFWHPTCIWFPFWHPTCLFVMPLHPKTPQESITWCPIWCFPRHQIRHQSYLVSNLIVKLQKAIWCHGKHQKASSETSWGIKYASMMPEVESKDLIWSAYQHPKSETVWDALWGIKVIQYFLSVWDILKCWHKIALWVSSTQFPWYNFWHQISKTSSVSQTIC